MPEQVYIGCPVCGLVMEVPNADHNGSHVCPDCRKKQRSIVMEAQVTSSPGGDRGDEQPR